MKDDGRGGRRRDEGEDRFMKEGTMTNGERIMVEVREERGRGRWDGR